MKLSDEKLFNQQCYIDGRWCDADAGSSFDVENPATGEVLGTAPRMGASETRRAIEAAQAAFKPWSGLMAKQRASILRKWFELIMEHQQDLATLMTLEQGKSLTESSGEIAYAASFIEWFAEEGKRSYGDVIPHTQDDKRYLTLKQPIGVVAAITPWNFPTAMITRKAGPALAAGCPVVLKPASSTPYSALALAELAARAGIPAGVFNVITGASNEIGAELTSNPLVKKVTFTGSTEIGKQLIAQAASTVKKVSMELGGNAPFLVFDDANLDAAVEGVLASKFRNSGQTCVCANRIYVQAAVYDEFIAKLQIAMEGLRVGNGLDAGTNQGPLIDQAAVEKVEEHLQDAVAKGGQLLCGGQRHELGGTFFQPTLVVGATQNMKIAREETFGPLAAVFKFATEQEGVAMANDTEFGLAAYFYANDMARVWRIAEALVSGMVAINTGILSNEVAPFGGVKESGLGREGSRYGLEEFLEIKYLCLGGIDA
ncbi:MAG: NAD-dependent succinate-semialdehyde dehydrogenase [Gammaproteobacteria bacterium]|jgi:succinate-semialdehyde dehydrogenase/glutarate-semialdehyde dehydrogenase|nr:NAD-dependent succinate-semialdehyde dehydrogenase [Gammaproteobacteria bacterium]MDP6734175.1 NAD-dependent succinate-semialdehyde dehydrogenase [Gammaproteobacteria bacterium]